MSDWQEYLSTLTSRLGSHCPSITLSSLMKVHGELVWWEALLSICRYLQRVLLQSHCASFSKIPSEASIGWGLETLSWELWSIDQDGSKGRLSQKILFTKTDNFMKLTFHRQHKECLLHWNLFKSSPSDLVCLWHGLGKKCIRCSMGICM